MPLNQVPVERKLPASFTRYRSVCFTVNNYTDADEILLQEHKQIKYLVYGIEEAKSGTPHLQGYIVFGKQLRFNAVRRMLPRGAHIERTRGTSLQASDYCKKGDQTHEEWTQSGTKGPNYGLNADVFEYGEMPSPGKRTDLHNAVDLIKNGGHYDDLMREHTVVMCKYINGMKAVLSWHEGEADKAILKDDYKDWIPRPWQQAVLNAIIDKKIKKDNRSVIWVVDLPGNAGKTELCDFIESKYDSTELIPPCKYADMAHMYKRREIVLIDIPRSYDKDFFPYRFVEDAINGKVGSSKYDSCLKRRRGGSIVIVFSNDDPDKRKLSADRWKYLMDVATLTEEAKAQAIQDQLIEEVALECLEDMVESPGVDNGPRSPFPYSLDDSDF